MKEQSGEEKAIDVSRIIPINTFLFVRKCKKKDAGLIILPDQAKDDTNFCEILAVGNKCKVFTAANVGGLVQVPEFADGLHFIVEGSSEYAMVKESLLEPVVYAQ